MESYNSDGSYDSDNSNPEQQGGMRATRAVASELGRAMGQSQSYERARKTQQSGDLGWGGEGLWVQPGLYENRPIWEPNKPSNRADKFGKIAGIVPSLITGAIDTGRVLANPLSEMFGVGKTSEAEWKIGKDVLFNINHYNVSNSVDCPVEDHGLTQYEATRFTNCFFSEMRKSLDGMINYFKNAKIHIQNYYDEEKSDKWNHIREKYVGYKMPGSNSSRVIEGAHSIMSKIEDLKINFGRHKINPVNKYYRGLVPSSSGGDIRWPNVYRKETLSGALPGDGGLENLVKGKASTGSVKKDEKGEVEYRYDAFLANKEINIIFNGKKKEEIRDSVKRKKVKMDKELTAGTNTVVADSGEDNFDLLEQNRIGIDHDKAIPTFRAMLTVKECDEIIEYLKNVRKMFIVMTDIGLSHQFQYSNKYEDASSLFTVSPEKNSDQINKIKEYFQQRKDNDMYPDLGTRNATKHNLEIEKKLIPGKNPHVTIGAPPDINRNNGDEFHVTKIPLYVPNGVKDESSNLLYPHKAEDDDFKTLKTSAGDFSEEHRSMSGSLIKDSVNGNLEKLSRFYNLAQDIDYFNNYMKPDEQKESYIDPGPDSTLCIPLPPLCFVNSYIDVNTFSNIKNNDKGRVIFDGDGEMKLNTIRFGTLFNDPDDATNGVGKSAYKTLIEKEMKPTT